MALMMAGPFWGQSVPDSLMVDSLSVTDVEGPLGIRKRVDTLAASGIVDFDRKAWGQLVLDSLPGFAEGWSENSLWPSTSDKTLDGDTLMIDLLEGGEEFYFNYWDILFWPYGPRWGRMHRGLDLGLDIGDTVRASFNGVVRYSKYNQGGYGNCVVIRHLNGLETLYGHFDKLLCKSGDLVMSGDVIGLGGTTGRSTGPHLHYEWRYKGKSFDSQMAISVDSLDLVTNTIVLTDKVLNDPPTSEIAKTARKKKYHTVKSGDTLSHLALKYKVSVRQIKSWNNLRSDLIQIGQKLRIR